MYTFKISTKKNKKYDVYKNSKYLVSFGDKNYQHYKDLEKVASASGFVKRLSYLLFSDIIMYSTFSVFCNKI